MTHELAVPRPPLSLVLAGPGLIGQRHGQLIRRHRACRLTAVVAPANSENMSFAKECCVPLFQDFEAAFGALDFDGAIISSPNAFHADQALACIRRGVPALVEKPLADGLDAARELVACSETTGVPVLVGHHRAYSALLEAGRRFVGSPEFGRPVGLQGAALFHKPASYFAAGPWRTQPGGGPLFINFIHEAGIMRSLFGEIESVFATASHEMRSFEVEDTAAIALRFANGALGTFLLSDAAASNKSWEMTSGEDASYPYCPGESSYHLTGTNGSLDFPSLRTRHYASDTEPSWWSSFEDGTLSVDEADPLQRQLDHFTQIVMGQAVPRVSARDGYNNMLVVEAARRSIDLGRPVSLAELI